MNEKLFNLVGPRMGKVCELVSFITLVSCKHVIVDVRENGVTITAYPYDEEVKDKVIGLMRMYAGKDNEPKVEYSTGKYHNWYTCELTLTYEKD